MNLRRITAAVTVTAILALLAGCSSDEGTEQRPGSSKAKTLQIKDKGVTAKGGTVHLLESGDFVSLDPANNYTAQDSTVGRLIYRTLTFIKDTPGEALSVQPDLAVNLGQQSEGGKTWTYKIRRGLKFENGKTITARDVKYGIQRAFAADVYPGGPPYMTTLLVNDNGYAGPYKTPDRDLTSVETPDDYTLVVHFKGPQPSADWMMSLFYTAPVPASDDTREQYRTHPIASGPYKIANYDPSSMVLVRNEQWNPNIDPNRLAYPDRFEFTFGVERPTINEKLLKGGGDDRYAASLSTLLEATLVQKLDDPSVNARFITGPTPTIDYLTFNTQVIQDPEVRHAIALAINRQGLLTLLGGGDFGALVDSIIPASFADYKAPNLGLKPGGDPEAAKKLLAGKSVPPVTFGYDLENSRGQKWGEQIKEDLKKVGIEVTLEGIPENGFTTRLAGPDAPAITYAGGWLYDWPDPSTIVLPVLGPDPTGRTWGENNYSKYFEPAVAAQIMQLSSSSESSNVIAAKFIDLANQIQTTAWPVLPLWTDLDPQLVGEGLTNAGVSPLFGAIDLNTVAVRS
jgi:peptide/nickel transport system substrate-binding protein